MKSYVKYLSRNKLYTAIEAVGLTVSLAFVILLGTYIWQQRQTYSGIPDADRICILGRDMYLGLSNNEKKVFEANPVPEIETIARYARLGISLEIDNEQWLSRVATYVDREWFDIFTDIKLESGSLDSFDDLNNVFVSRSFADVLGNDVIGKTIVDIENWRTYVIAGVIEDFDGSFFLDTDIIINNHVLSPDNSQIDFYEPFTHFTFNFIKMAEGAYFKDIEAKAKDVLETVVPYWYNDDLFRMRFYTLKQAFYGEAKYNPLDFRAADPKEMTVLVIIVLALLISAVFNYINLSFALITKRAKEIATRRLVGASRLSIIWKCICESILFTVICFALALLIAVAFEPVMNSMLLTDYVDRYVSLHVSLSLRHIVSYIGSALVLGFIVGVIPAVNMSSFAPIDVVRGSFRAKSKMIFSKCFIVVQSVLAIVLIAMGILMEAQLRYMTNMPVNCNTENSIFMRYTAHPALRENPELSHALYDALLENPHVKRVAYSSGYPRLIAGQIRSYITLFNDDGSQSRPNMLFCDSLYFEMLGLEIIEDRQMPLHRSVWLSESLVKAFPLTDSTEAQMFAYQDYTDHVGGIYKDIPTFGSKFGYSAIEVLSREDIKSHSLMIETYEESPEVLESIRRTCRDLLEDPDVHYDVREEEWVNFVSDYYEIILIKTVAFIRLVELFMLLAVLLSLMGLVAMSTYFSDQKSKDIAICKVFGGTVATETIANVRSYMLMVLIAGVIAVPIAVYFSGRYLEQFPYRIENYWWVFAVAILLSFAISLLSVLWQTLKAARTNPATELKKE